MSSGIPIIGGMFQAKAIGEESAATADALSRDADLQRKNAEIAREAGKYNAARQQDEANKSYGATSVDVAAAGVTQDSGSVLDILRQSHQNAELDRLNILHGAEIKAIDAQNRASSLDKQADSVLDQMANRQYAALFGGAAQGVGNMSSGGSGSAQSSGSGNVAMKSTAGERSYRTYDSSSYMDA